jgi:hypothetical protein
MDPRFKKIEEQLRAAREALEMANHGFQATGNLALTCGHLAQAIEVVASLTLMLEKTVGRTLPQ